MKMPANGTDYMEKPIFRSSRKLWPFSFRAGAYAILALLRYAGQTGPNYFLE